jgi:hypothetical protein
LFNGRVKTINTSLGFNQNSTVITTTIVRDGLPITVANRQLVDISIGALDFVGVVQSWTEAKTDVAGTGVYQVRITDTKPVLEAAQVIIGSSFNDAKTAAYDYGQNVIPIVFQSATQLSDGIPFSVIQSSIESATIRYGTEDYTVVFDFTLPDRGSSVEYSMKGKAMSLVDLISQAANDHGLDWYVTTTSTTITSGIQIGQTRNVISVKMFGRSNITDVTVNQLAALHQNEVIRRHEGDENRDAIQKVVLIGGYRSYLHQADGSLWSQFWGFDSNGNKRSQPVYSTDVMEQVINNDFTSEDYSERDVQKILSYANEFWGRKFIGLITPPTAISSNGRSWVTPTSAAWNESDTIPMDFSRDGQLKFQNEDGRWITFASLPLPGLRFSTGVRLTYQWDDELFSNTNSYIDDDGNISVKASLEIVDGFSEIEYWLEQFIIYMLNQDDFTSVSNSRVRFIISNPEMSSVVRLDFIRLTRSINDELTEIANGTLIYTDAVKNSFREGFSDQYFVLTLATPLRVRTTEKDTVTNEATGESEVVDKITKTRLETLDNTYLALLDQRQTYGPWLTGNTSIGRTEVIIDSSLTPWSFGYRGINNTTGQELLDIVALARIKTIADVTLDAKTAELEVAGLPAVNIGDQLQTTGTITSLDIIFDIKGIRTIYKSLQYTNDLSKHIRQQQDLLDSLRRQAAEFNNTMQPQQDDYTLDRALRTLKKELPEPPVDVSNEGVQRVSKQLLGRIYARSSNTEPKYHLTPMAWVSDVFGELSLVQDPQVFGNYLNVVNMGERQTAPGRLPIGTDVQVNEFSVTEGGIVSYYMDVAAPAPQSFTASVVGSVSNERPLYHVVPIVNSVQQINLLPSELLALNSVLNIGEPENFKGYLGVGTEVTVAWNENADGSFTPFIEQQLNLFKPLGD